MSITATLALAAALFAIAALGGIAMVGIRIHRGRNPPRGLVLIHGLLAATGVLVLAWGGWRHPLPDLGMWALGLFVLAAIGGATLNFGFDRRGRPIPVALAVGHGLIALVAFGCLLFALRAAAS